jgi:hypothetical protein
VTATYLEDNIIEFEMVFLDPDNDDAPVDPSVVTAQFWFSPNTVQPYAAYGSVITYAGAVISAVNTISRMLNDDGVYCYRVRFDTTGLPIPAGVQYAGGMCKWKSTGSGQAADNDYALIESN